jgi:fluoride exporter
MEILAVGFGGAFGAIARYLTTDWVRQLLGAEFPWGTMVVNLVGSFAIGFVLVWLQSMAPSSQLRHFLVIGFLGSFTTFSTYSYETVALVRSGDMWRAGGYATGSLMLGLVAVIVGAALATAMTQARA